jgi:hypothetical protein
MSGFKLQTTDSKLRTSESKLEMDHPKLAIDDPELQVDDSKLEVDDPKLETHHPELRTDDSKLEPRHSKLEAGRSKLEVRHSKLEIDESELGIDASKHRTDIRNPLPANAIPRPDHAGGAPQPARRWRGRLLDRVSAGVELSRTMNSTHADVIVIGAGAIGAATAYALVQRGVKVLVLEKEDGPARHQSSRNSGVIHAGYNLKPGSVKARYAVEGNRRLKAFCREHGIPLLEGGILIVARTEAERKVLAELKRRADANGVTSEIVNEQGIREIEAHASGIEALHAPEGASFDGGAYVAKLVELVRAGGGEVRYGC